MPKKNRREQQHLRQEPSRRRSYTAANSAPKDIYKPGFPMNVLGNLKAFSIVGVGIAVIMVAGAFLSQRNRDTGDPNALPSVTPTAQSSTTAEASASPTVSAKQFAKAEQVVDAATKQYKATVKTNKGDFEVKLYADQAPNTVNSFAFLASKGYFDGLLLHRVQAGFVIQGGDPKGNGTGGPGYTTAEEPNQLSNKRMTLSMAKVGGAKDFGSQFFINLKDNTSLDYTNSGDKFYPFGEVTSGQEVVDQIAQVKVDARFKPVEDVVIQSVTISDSAK
ncbi:MAG: peptidylprolyl isomerase [Tepidiformaceae bacterium]